MPITFNLVAHPANSLVTDPTKPIELLRQCAPAVDLGKCLLHSSSFGPAESSVNSTLNGRNGLVDAVLTAHNTHHALILRPDDVWLTVAVQFSFFVNKHAEKLRGRFVAHEGKKVIRLENSRSMTDAAVFVPEFVKEIRKHITDTTVYSWIVPNFSTTTDNDRVVGAAVLMGAMKKYFDYYNACCCGIPRVTLEGTRADWEEVLRRADKIAEYGDECVLWHRALVPVLRNIVKTFDDPQLKNETTCKFWKSLVHFEDPDSGQSHISGWVTSFCAFDVDGKWLLDLIYQWDAPMSDGVRYPIVQLNNIPSGCVTVDITLDFDDGAEREAVLVAGVATQRVSSSGDTKLSKAGVRDCVAPGVAFWFVEKGIKGEKQSQPQVSVLMRPIGEVDKDISGEVTDVGVVSNEDSVDVKPKGRFSGWLKGIVGRNR